MDLLIGVIMVVSFCTRSKALPELADYRPTATLLGARTMSGILFPYLSMLAAWFIALLMLWQEDWYGEKFDPILDLHLPGQLWMLRGDNFESAVAMLMLFTCLTTVAFTNTYGGVFRQNVFKNAGVVTSYGLWLAALFGMAMSNSNEFNCIFRVNCDMEQSLAAGNIPLLSFFSTGGVGGCFLGPQTVAWQEQMAFYGWTG